jgi:hypothetical protein
MLSTAAEGVDVERLLREADAILRSTAPRPAPVVPPPGAALWRDAVRARLDEARAWATGQPPAGALAGRRWPVRALLRLVFWPMRVLAWPQRRCNRATLAALDLLLNELAPVGRDIDPATFAANVDPATFAADKGASR